MRQENVYPSGLVAKCVPPIESRGQQNGVGDCAVSLTTSADKYFVVALPNVDALYNHYTLQTLNEAVPTKMAIPSPLRPAEHLQQHL